MCIPRVEILPQCLIKVRKVIVNFGTLVFYARQGDGCREQRYCQSYLCNTAKEFKLPRASTTITLPFGQRLGIRLFRCGRIIQVKAFQMLRSSSLFGLRLLNRDSKRRPIEAIRTMEINLI